MKATRRSRRGARHLFRVCMASGVLDEQRARDVARRLGASRRRGALAMLSEFHRLVRLDRERHTALVESAQPLPADQWHDVQARLVSRYGPGLQTTFAHTPDLIGGVRIKVGSDVYDGSVRGRLAALESSW
jgi:F-type H+-transporting ATPase subunit delta